MPQCTDEVILEDALLSRAQKVCNQLESNVNADFMHCQYAMHIVNISLYVNMNSFTTMHVVNSRLVCIEDNLTGALLWQ